MKIAVALQRLSALLAASGAILDSAQRVSAAIQRAREEDRDLTSDELDDFAKADDIAADALARAIQQRNSG